MVIIRNPLVESRATKRLATLFLIRCSQYIEENWSLITEASGIHIHEKSSVTVEHRGKNYFCTNEIVVDLDENVVGLTTMVELNEQGTIVSSLRQKKFYSTGDMNEVPDR